MIGRAGAAIAVLAGVFASSGGVSAATCEQWKVPARFDIRQGVSGTISFEMKQDGARLWGRAGYATSKKSVVGNINQASLYGDQFTARVLWTYSGVNAIGVYQGKVWSSGQIQGITYDEFNPKSRDSWTSLSPMRCETGTTEPNMDRPGGDYRSFELPVDSPDFCRRTCLSEAQCKAYSYVKPGLQGPKARCWLKASIPNYQPSDCCVSGIVRGSVSIMPVGAPPPPPTVPSAPTSSPSPPPPIKPAKPIDTIIRRSAPLVVK